MNPKITPCVNIKSVVKVTPTKKIHKSKQQQHGQHKDKGTTDGAHLTMFIVFIQVVLSQP